MRNIRSYFMHYLAVAALSLFAALLSVSAQAGGLSVASSCNPVAQSACGLPFPSDLFRNTAGKLNYSDKILDKQTSGYVHDDFTVASQLPDNFLPSQVLNSSHGFSALGPVAFELSDFPIDPIPEDGEGVLVVFDRDTLQEVPMIVSLSKIANPQRELREKRAVIIAWPRSRFSFGERYIAVLLRTQLHTLVNGISQPLSPSEGMSKVLNDDASYFVQGAYDPVLEIIEQKGIASSDILSVTYFTVRPEDEVVSPIQSMVTQAISQPLAVTDIKKRSALGSEDYGYGTFEGHLRLVNFRDEDGGVYPPYTPIADSDFDTTEFILTLPKPATGNTVPVSLWGHGLANDKALAASAFTHDDDIGVATFAIDHPNHASRVITWNNKAPHIAALVRSPQNMMHLLGMFVQSSVDFAVATQTVHDALPGAVNGLRSQYSDIPAIDNSRIIYQGVSLGGMIGPTVGAVSPFLKGAFLINGASSLMQIFSESVMWDGNTSMIIPPNANGAEAVVILAMMQHYVDIADGNNFAHFFRQPPAGQSTRKLGMLYAVGDGSLTNNASLATAEIAQLPLMKEVIDPVSFLPQGELGSAGHVDGYGILQSGFGSDTADQILDEIKVFDPALSQAFDGINVLQQLETLTQDLLPDQSGEIADMLDLVLAALGEGDSSESFSGWIEQFYEGDIETFLTHFNRNSVEAVTANVDWACELLSLDATRCAFAKAKAAEPKDNSAIDIPGLPDDLIDRAQDQLDEILDSGTITVQVNAGSAGAMEAPVLVALSMMLLVIPVFRRKDWRRRLHQLLRQPSFRTLGSAFLSLLTWGGWACIANGWDTPDGLRAGVSQGLTSFCTTLAGSVMLELLFYRLGTTLAASTMAVLVVSSFSLMLMLMVHLSTGTPHLVLTITPIYLVVVLYCASYVGALRKLSVARVVHENT